MAVLTTVPTLAMAAEGAGDLSDFVVVLERLGGASLALVIAAVVIISLLIWRVAAMIRRETTPVTPPRRGTRGDDASRDSPPTDWGFDQNKRSAQSRTAVAAKKADIDLPSLEHAVTQWSMSDVHHASTLEVVPDDALGKAPTNSASPYRTSFNPYFRRERPASDIEVVEVADALLQAELLVQLGDPKQAMTLLSHHIRNTEKPGPAVWLMLLSLYQSTGREAQYNALGDGFRSLFNAAVPPWATSPAEAERDLESYLPAMLRVQTAWRGPQARPAIEALLNDDRGGSRQGFSLTAYRELLFLSEVLDALDAIDAEEGERSGIQRKLGTTA